MGLFSNSKEKSAYYQIPVECTNCNNTGLLNILKGKLKGEAVKDNVCNKCGCNTLKLLSDEEYLKLNPPKPPGSGGLF